MISAQVSIPPGNQPESGSLFDQIFGPLMPLLSSAWWIVLHLVVPGVLIVGVAGLVLAAVTGNRQGMVRARGVIVAVPMALILAGVAVIAANWAIGTYA